MKPEDLVRGMNDYYAGRVPWHDAYMGYTDNRSMEQLLGPLIEWFEADIRGADVLEVACGTGNWTQVLARRAGSVTATDVNRSALDMAERKPYASERVSFLVADAYTLEGVPGTYNAAFAADWWSHIPKSRIPAFLRAVSAKLAAGSPVIVVDMLPARNLTYLGTYHDDEGNLIHPRKLPSGEEFEVVKNFPTEQELIACVEGFGREVTYRAHDGLRRWMLKYSTV